MSSAILQRQLASMRHRSNNVNYAFIASCEGGEVTQHGGSRFGRVCLCLCLCGGLAFSGNALVSINEVPLCRARLVLGWVAVSRCEKIYLSIQPATQVNSNLGYLRG